MARLSDLETERAAGRAIAELPEAVYDHAVTGAKVAGNPRAAAAAVAGGAGIAGAGAAAFDLNRGIAEGNQSHGIEKTLETTSNIVQMGGFLGAPAVVYAPVAAGAVALGAPALALKGIAGAASKLGYDETAANVAEKAASLGRRRLGWNTLRNAWQDTNFEDVPGMKAAGKAFAPVTKIAGDVADRVPFLKRDSAAREAAAKELLKSVANENSTGLFDGKKAAFESMQEKLVKADAALANHPELAEHLASFKGSFAHLNAVTESGAHYLAADPAGHLANMQDSAEKLGEAAGKIKGIGKEARAAISDLKSGAPQFATPHTQLGVAKAAFGQHAGASPHLATIEDSLDHIKAAVHSGVTTETDAHLSRLNRATKELNSLGAVEGIAKEGRLATSALKAHTATLESSVGGAIDKLGVGKIKVNKAVMHGANVAMGAGMLLSTIHTAEHAKIALRDLKTALAGDDSKFAKDLIKREHWTILKRAVPAVGIDLGATAIGMMTARGGGNMMTMAGIGQMVAMKAEDYLPKSSLLPAFDAMNKAQKTGQQLTPAHYATLLSAASPTLAELSPEVIGLLTPGMAATQMPAAQAIASLEPARLQAKISGMLEQAYAGHEKIPAGHYAALMTVSSPHIAGAGTTDGLVAKLAAECAAAQTAPAALIADIKSGAFSRHAYEVEERLKAEGRTAGARAAVTPPAAPLAAAPVAVHPAAGPALPEQPSAVIAQGGAVKAGKLALAAPSRSAHAL